MPPESRTRSRILDVAEDLFASRGYKNVSLRELTAAAEANLASVRYYFGSKDQLLYAIYERYCTPLNNARLQRLAECAPGDGRPPMIEQIIAAFLEPALDVSVDAVGGGARFTRLRAVLIGENLDFLEDLIARNFDTTSLTFVEAIRKEFPALGREEVLWRFSFVLGILHYMLIDPNRIRRLSRGRCDPGDSRTMARFLVPFIAEGFRAPGIDAPTTAVAPRAKAGRRTRRRDKETAA
ncbi:TetR/AcrR family transcriptional regulator [Shumkonia mesophila]|uniref:TetR/AcrR family transcriptional regulator n=1 Tax=Shumkonia mesophila TaxID=2838854 RepID=UPI002934EE37|nr:TetR/AcrR family transcriptional regulator [Shumkonia mesophila]